MNYPCIDYNKFSVTIKLSDYALQTINELILQFKSYIIFHCK